MNEQSTCKPGFLREIILMNLSKSTPVSCGIIISVISVFVIVLSVSVAIATSVVSDRLSVSQELSTTTAIAIDARKQSERNQMEINALRTEIRSDMNEVLRALGRIEGSLGELNK